MGKILGGGSVGKFGPEMLNRWLKKLLEDKPTQVINRAGRQSNYHNPGNTTKAVGGVARKVRLRENRRKHKGGKRRRRWTPLQRRVADCANQVATARAEAGQERRRAFVEQCLIQGIGPKQMKHYLWTGDYLNYV